MFGFRQKLLMGFGGMLAILLVVSGMSIAVLRAHRSQLDTFLYENWRSVEYGQNMVDALDRLNDLALTLHTAAAAPTQAQLDSARALLTQFETNLKLEDGNITLAGERDIAQRLTIAGVGNDLLGAKQPLASYVGTYRRLLDPALTPADRDHAFATLLQLDPTVRREAQAVVQLNLANMTPVEGRIKDMADRATLLMVGLSIAGVALSLIFVAVVRRTILQPVQALTASAREIEQGNLDLVVQVNSHDELQQLAEAFNSMAAKLREYRRTNRAKLVRTQQTTQNAINSLPDAVAILGPDGTIEMANSATQTLFGLRIDAHVSELHVDWLSKLWQEVCEYHRPIEPRGYESAVQVLDEGGGEKFFLPRAVPILDEDRLLIGVTIVLADMTHLRRLDEMKSSMLSVVSHELKTPLTSIRMGVHLLLEERVGSLTAQQNDLLVAVRDDSTRLHEIVDNLLDMSRIESGRALMELKPMPVQRIVSDATEALMAAFHDHGIELSVEVADDLPAVLVDPTRIGHVFSNLLGNALKYTPPGGTVRVVADVEDAHVRISVIDTGSGISDAHIERVFDRFFRVPGQSGGSGAGLGLAIAKEIVEAHGGRISASSREHAGSTFSFTLQQAHVTDYNNQTEDEHVVAHSDR